ncbi:MAG: deoxyribonuclease IV [Candidatus Limnocylindrales bacterium]
MIPDPLAALGGRRIGVHLALGLGLVKAADRARDIGATTVQVFTDNPTSWRRRAEPPRALQAFRQRLAAHDVSPTATHAAYLINLAGPEPEFWSRSVDVLAAELRMATLYDARLVNMHVGSHRGSGFEAGRRRLAQGIVRAFEIEGEGEANERADGGSEPADPPHRPLLVLENSAGSGDGMGTTVEELAGILEALDEAGAPMARIAVCLDTAHLWAAGHEISRPEVIDTILADTDRQLGPERLAMLHLNDSKAALGSHLDRHEHIGAGRIGEPGMRHLLSHPRLRVVPMFLETPGMDEGYDAVNMDRVRALLAGEALATLPAEAFALRSSRARVAPAD